MFKSSAWNQGLKKKLAFVGFLNFSYGKLYLAKTVLSYPSKQLTEKPGAVGSDFMMLISTEQVTFQLNFKQGVGTLAKFD